MNTHILNVVMNVLSWVGLFIGIMGPILVILPTIPKIKRLIVDQTTINNLNECRKSLPKDYVIDERLDGFIHFKEIVRENVDGELVDDCQGFRVPQIGYESEQGDRVFQHGNIVYSVDKCAVDTENPIYDDHSVEIGSIFVVDSWVRDHIDYMINIRIQTVRGVGLFLIIISVFLQGLLVS